MFPNGHADLYFALHYACLPSYFFLDINSLVVEVSIVCDEWPDRIESCWCTIPRRGDRHQCEITWDQSVTVG